MTPTRTELLTGSVAAAGLTALVVSDRANVGWLTGFTGTAGTVVVTGAGTPTGTTLVIDGRYPLQAARQAPDVELVVDRSTPTAVAAVLARGLRAGTGSARGTTGTPAAVRVGVETHVLTVDAHAALAAAIRQALPGTELVGAGRLVERLRRVKDSEELAAVGRACAVSVAALEALVTGSAGPLAGRTEREVVRELDALLVAGGADAPAFDTIVAAGPNSASPHHDATDRSLSPGDLVVVDFGARVDGYCADMTRTLFVAGPDGATAAPWQRELHALVARANAAGRAAVVAGAGVAAVDAAARDLIVAAGHGPDFAHGLGHGVGRDVHEDPLLQAAAAGNLAAGEVVTIEPGVYLAGRGGVRIEDTVVVRDGGVGPGVLTASVRDLVAVA